MVKSVIIIIWILMLIYFTYKVFNNTNVAKKSNRKMATIPNEFKNEKAYPTKYSTSSIQREPPKRTNSTQDIGKPQKELADNSSKISIEESLASVVNIKKIEPKYQANQPIETNAHELPVEYTIRKLKELRSILDLNDASEEVPVKGDRKKLRVLNKVKTSELETIAATKIKIANAVDLDTEKETSATFKVEAAPQLDNNAGFPQGEIKVLYINTNRGFNNSFPNNADFIYWEPAPAALTFAKKTKYLVRGVQIIGVTRDRQLIGLYQFGKANEAEEHPDLKERILLVRSLFLNQHLRCPRGFVFGRTWLFPGT